MQKRKKFTRVENTTENPKIDEWESNFYESLKNSSESEFNEDGDTASKNSDVISKRKAKRNLKLNFKKKILKSEKKSNLIKLNINLKQLVFDEFHKKGERKNIVNYKNVAESRSSQVGIVVCSICYCKLYAYRCTLCLLPFCQACRELHPEINCNAFAKY